MRLSTTEVKATDTQYKHTRIEYNGVYIGYVMKDNYWQVWTFTSDNQNGFTRFVPIEKRNFTMCDNTTAKTKAKILSKVFMWVSTGTQK